MAKLPAPTLHEAPGRRLWLAPGLEGEDPAAWLAGGVDALEQRAQQTGEGRVLDAGLEDPEHASGQIGFSVQRQVSSAADGCLGMAGGGMSRSMRLLADDGGGLY